ncbi:MAG: hypothetical protein ACOYB3_03890, partial [Azonexus sp.]
YRALYPISWKTKFRGKLIAQTSVYAAFNRRKLKWLEAKEAGLCIKCGAPVDAKGRYIETRVVK